MSDGTPDAGNCRRCLLFEGDAARGEATTSGGTVADIPGDVRCADQSKFGEESIFAVVTATSSLLSCPSTAKLTIYWFYRSTFIVSSWETIYPTIFESMLPRRTSVRKYFCFTLQPMTSIDLPGAGDKVVLKIAGEHLRASVAVGELVFNYNVYLNFLSSTGNLTLTGAPITTSHGDIDGVH